MYVVVQCLYKQRAVNIINTFGYTCEIFSRGPGLYHIVNGFPNLLFQIFISKAGWRGILKRNIDPSK